MMTKWYMQADIFPRWFFVASILGYLGLTHLTDRILSQFLKVASLDEKPFEHRNSVFEPSR